MISASDARRRDRGWMALGLSVLATALYLGLLSQHYIGDGIRWLPIITRLDSPAVGDVRHLFSPTLGWGWYHLALALGYSGDPIPVLQALNALSAGLGIGLYYYLLQQLIRIRPLSLWGCLLLMFCYSHNTHATDMTEIMPSLPLLLGSLILALWSSKRTSWLLAVVSALLISLATSIYITSLLYVFVAICILLTHGKGDVKNAGFRLTLTFVLSIFIFVPVLFISGYRLHSHSVSEAVGAILSFRERGLVDLGFDLSHIGGTLLGLAGALLGLKDFSGGRRMLMSLDSGTAQWNLGITILTFAMTAVLTIWIGLVLRRRGGPHEETWRRGLILGFLWTIPNVILIWYAAPANNKLWVHPMPGVIFLILCGLALLYQSDSYRKAAKRWIVAFAGIVVGVNLTVHMVPRHLSPSPYLEDAKRVAEMMQKEDLLISEDFDGVSVYVQAIFKENVFSFYVTGSELAFDNTRLYRSLRETVDRHLRNGGRIYFVSIFDFPPNGRENSLGVRRGLDYSMFDFYRQQSQPILPLRSLVQESGQPIWLWKYEEPS